MNEVLPRPQAPRLRRNPSAALGIAPRIARCYAQRERFFCPRKNQRRAGGRRLFRARR